MREYIDRKALDVLFDRKEIRTLSIGKDLLDATTVKYVSISMHHNLRMGFIEFYIKCQETGAFNTRRIVNSHYKDSAYEDENAVKADARKILCGAIQLINEYRVSKGYYEVSFITPSTTTYADAVKNARDVEFINISQLPASDEVYSEDDFVPNPDGSRPWKHYGR